MSRSFKANASPKLSIQILVTCYGFARVFHDTSIWKKFRIWTNGQDHKLIGLEICSVKPLYDFTPSYALKIIRKFGKVGWVQVVYFQLKQYARRGIYGLYIFLTPPAIRLVISLNASEFWRSLSCLETADSPSKVRINEGGRTVSAHLSFNTKKYPQSRRRCGRIMMSPCYMVF